MMNFQEFLYNEIVRSGAAAVPDFGRFISKKSDAHYDVAASVLVPPGIRIHFEPDYSAKNPELPAKFAAGKSISESQASSEILQATNFWKNKINAGETFEIEPLGRFIHNNEQLEFAGSRIDSENPDFYGLEEIRLSDIKPNTTAATTAGSDFKINKSAWLALPFLALLALAIWNREALFGKKSFENSSVKTAKLRPKNDSLSKTIIPKIDSAKTDSLTKTANPVAKKHTATKKWHAKTYKKSKWRLKKHRNRSR